jgi:hypothetical protein
MSGRLVGEVLRCAPESLTTAELVVLMILAEGARDKDRTARYSSKTIAWLSRLSEGTVRNALSSLAHRALIQPLHRTSKGHSQDYRLTPLSEHHRGTARHPPMTRNGQHASSTDDTPATEGVTHQ